MTRIHVVTESAITDETGNRITVWYVDVRDPAHRSPITTLIKGGHPEHAIDKLGSIRVSKPARFREFGEGLIRDLSEAQASSHVKTLERVDDPTDLQESQRFNDEVARCAASIGESLSRKVISSKITEESVRKILFGKNCWMYSTSIEPPDHEAFQHWKNSMPDGYKPVARICRPRQFAWSLGLMVTEQLGPHGSEETLKESYDGGEVVERRVKGQLILHGPVIYVPNTFEVISGASSPIELMALMLFIKDSKFAAQREYRFLISTKEEPPPNEEVVDLKVSKAMFGSLEERPVPTAQPEEVALAAEEPVDRPVEVVSSQNDNNDEDEEHEQLMESSLARGGFDGFPFDDFPFDDFPFDDGPSTRLVPSNKSVGAYKDPQDVASAAALQALRSKVEQVQGDRRMRAASSAWHAEPWIRRLCEMFVDPIGAVWITDDDILVVDLKFPKGVDASAKIAFGPSGARVEAAKGKKSQLISRNSSSIETSYVPESLVRKLSALGLERRPILDTAIPDSP